MDSLVADTAIALLSELPKGCLPDKSREWTVFSAICEEDKSKSNFRVVSAGTGTKCLSKSELNSEGYLLHDSHGEIIAIRAFKRYLISELNHFIQSQSKESSIFEGSLQEGFRIKDTIKYHFFTTHPPCGDATIFPVNQDNPNEPPPTKKVKIVDDRSFTGAKLLGQLDGADVLAQGEGYVRIKPGRGERTLSMSCSDKLAKLLVMGVQGSFLSSLVKEPIYLDSIVLSKNSGYCHESLDRALYKRFTKNKLPSEGNKFQLQVPQILESSSVDFPFPKDDAKSPCPKSLIWCSVKDKQLEVSVDGRRQGVAKNNICRPSSRLKICRCELFLSFLSLLRLKHPNENLDDLSYAEVKEKYCTDYMSTWNALKRDYFQQWTEKP